MKLLKVFQVSLNYHEGCWRHYVSDTQGWATITRSGGCTISTRCFAINVVLQAIVQVVAPHQQEMVRNAKLLQLPRVKVCMTS